MDIIKTITYNSLKDFIEAISYQGELYKFFSPDYIFRGVPSTKYELIPSALRKDNVKKLHLLSYSEGGIPSNEFTQIQSEYLILKRFYEECDKYSMPLPNVDRIRDYMLTDNSLDLLYNTSEGWLPHDFYELAALAQHYGLPTRLLDWSKNIYTALYFAAISNIDNVFKDEYIVLWAFKHNIIQNKVPNIKIINPYYYGNPNLSAQQGVFTLWETKPLLISKEPYRTDVNRSVERRPLNELIDENLINNKTELKNETPFYKIQIHSDNSNRLLIFLHEQGYDTARLFPGYAGIAKRMEEGAKIFFNCF
jgi:hypothetical protein